MAEASVLINCNEFCCSVCLELLNDPVTLACGHSFCKSCITSIWDQRLWMCSCPQCRVTFVIKPSLHRNDMLASLMEKLRERGLQFSDHCYDKSEDVECDICTGIKCKAVRSCLVCLASYCADHFRPHMESSALMKHTVTKASANLHEKICPQHGKPLEVFCRTDEQCICYLCILAEHSNHDIVSAVAERSEKEKQVLEAQNNNTQRILEREEDHRELVQSLESIKHSAQVAVANTERLRQELIQTIVKKFSEVTNQIRAQENVELTRTKEHLKQVEQETVELKSKNEELDQLLQTQDDLLFFQSFKSFHDLSLPESIPRVNIFIPHSYDNVKIFVHKLIENIESTILCPDSASHNRQQMTSQNTQNAWHPKQSPLLSFNSVPNFHKPASKSQFTFGSQIPFVDTLAKTSAESQTTFSFFSTPATQPQSNFGFQKPTGFELSSTPATQSHTLFGLSSTPATQSHTLFGLSSTPATQSHTLFGLSSTPTTQSHTLFGLSSTPATQSHTLFGLSSTPATRSQTVFGLSSTPAIQSHTLFGLSSTPATQSQTVFGLSSTPATQSQTVFGLSSTPATQSQTVFGLSSTPASRSQTVFGLSSTPASRSQTVFGLSSIPATQSQTEFGLSSTPAAQAGLIFGYTKTTSLSSKK